MLVKLISVTKIQILFDMDIFFHARSTSYMIVTPLQYKSQNEMYKKSRQFVRGRSLFHSPIDFFIASILASRAAFVWSKYSFFVRVSFTPK